jgi:site-specific recombinase XerC
VSILMEEFQKSLTLTQGRSPRTVLAYTGAVNRFAKFVEQTPRDGDPLTVVDEADFQGWRAFELGKKCKSTSLSLWVSGLRAFYGWLVRTGKLAKNPMPEEFRVTVKVQEPTRVPSFKELMWLRMDLEKRPIQERAFVELLMGSGLRVSAALTLHRKHFLLDGDRPYVMVDAEEVQCKGHHAGAVYMTPHACACVSAWLAAPACPTDGPVFPWSYDHAHDRVHCAGVRVGVELKPHALRHAFCSFMYFRSFFGGAYDIVAVKVAAGHSNIQTSAGYLNSVARVVTSESQWWEWSTGTPIPRKSGFGTRE